MTREPLSLTKPDAPRRGAGSRTIVPALAAALGLASLFGAGATRATAAPSLLMDLPSGMVLYEDDATRPWFPASLTKLMTTYVALRATQDGRISMATPLRVSARAAAAPPSKMGFRPGTLVTLGDALKILMVKSANDVSITVAEGISGSVEAFAAEMNAEAARLGMRQSHFVNPNGLPNPQHYTSARDIALLVRGLYLGFPQYAGLFNIGALELGGKVMNNHNNLLGRYPGADGMKTGFTCAAGFNVAATATQGGRKLVAVVLGAPNVALRTVKAAALFDRGFAGVDRPMAPISALPLQGGAPPDIGASVCRNRGPAIAAFSAENERLIAPLEAASAQAFASTQGASFYDSSALSRVSPMATRIAFVPPPSFEPVPIRIAGYEAPARGAAAEDDDGASAARLPAAAAAAKRAAKPEPRHAQKTRVHIVPKHAKSKAHAPSIVKIIEEDDAPKAKGKAKGAAHAKPEPAPRGKAAQAVKGKGTGQGTGKGAAKPTQASARKPQV
ncbi:D-alanyl-D-alanine carboxypeptidase family protein [Methylocella sp.]|uniref:D-alanyl-D-alanine carboxypeptidase family protein n=1 Tax=Methylocella sp. TaxID=1978226 RepID=UPI003784C5EC